MQGTKRAPKSGSFVPSIVKLLGASTVTYVPYRGDIGLLALSGRALFEGQDTIPTQDSSASFLVQEKSSE